jgi:hypothetical protein
MIKIVTYIKNAIDDIELALKERGVFTDRIALNQYGNLIRSIESGENGTGDKLSFMNVAPATETFKHIASDGTICNGLDEYIKHKFLLAKEIVLLNLTKDLNKNIVTATEIEMEEVLI